MVTVKRTTDKTERMNRVACSAQVGATLRVLHDDSPQGYSVSLHASEDGAYEAVLARIQALVDDQVDMVGEDDDVVAALNAKDGRAALKALEALISNKGLEAAGEVCMWVTEQKVEK